MLGYAEAEYDGGLYGDYVGAREMKLAHFRERLQVVRSHAPGGRLLDVGCACGYFLEVAANNGYDVWGLEFSRNAIAAAQPEIRPRIIHASLDALGREHEGRYDIISAFDIIEHLEQPVEFLRQAKRLLRPGGSLVISTPDADHWLRPLMGARWPMLQPMQHLTIFSRQSLRAALDAAGFRTGLVVTAHKVLSYQYLIDQLRLLNPMLHPVLTGVSRVVPRRVMQRYRKVNIGEVLAIASTRDEGNRA
jgi:2-polyprenyl-3-methyl-5-hydroxy-6-metoxy-1,4-benzoquinol methylase